MYTCTIPGMKQFVKKNRTSVTRDMVASEAGVSSATVSRVYNSPDSVSPEKRAAVTSAARRLGYTPNKSASALRRQGTGIITLVEFDKGARPYYWNDLPVFNWFYGDVIKGVKQTIDHTMYTLNLATVSDEEELLALQESSDAFLFFDVDDEHEVSMIEKVRVPYVAAHHTNAYEHLYSCSTDNRFGGMLQAQELYDRGVKRPLYLTSHLQDVIPHADRLQGFLSRWRELSDCEPVVLEMESRYRRLEEMIPMAELSGKEADGIASLNDVLMLRVLNRVTFRGVPLVGYDANPVRDIIPYRLPSVDIQQRRIYERAAKMLIERLGSPSGATAPHREVIRPVLVSG